MFINNPYSTSPSGVSKKMMYRDQIYGSKLGIRILVKNLKYHKRAQTASTVTGAHRTSAVAMVSSECTENIASPSMPKLL